MVKAVLTFQCSRRKKTCKAMTWVKWKVVVFWGLSIDDSGEDEDDDPPHPDYSGGVRGGV